MKNISKITSTLRVLLVCGFLFATTFLRAQSCGVTINNNLPCDVYLDISFFETTATCSPCSNNPINVTVLGNGGITVLNCLNISLWSCFTTICDISVSFTSPFTAGPFFYSAGSQPLPGSPCGSTVNANIVFTPSSIDINP